MAVATVRSLQRHQRNGYACRSGKCRRDVQRVRECLAAAEELKKVIRWLVQAG